MVASVDLRQPVPFSGGLSSVTADVHLWVSGSGVIVRESGAVSDRGVGVSARRPKSTTASVKTAIKNMLTQRVNRSWKLARRRAGAWVLVCGSEVGIFEQCERAPEVAARGKLYSHTPA